VEIPTGNVDMGTFPLKIPLTQRVASIQVIATLQTTITRVPGTKLFAIEWVDPGFAAVFDGDVVPTMGLVDIDFALKSK
jgi:hypothetical protein